MSMSRGLLNNWWYVFDEFHVVTRIIIFFDILPVNYPGTKLAKTGLHESLWYFDQVRIPKLNT